MNDGKINNRLSAIEASLKALRNHVTKIDANFETLRQQYATTEQKKSPDNENNPTPSVTLVESTPNDAQNSKTGADKSNPWLTGLQVVGIFAGVVVAIASVAQWCQLGQNFRIDQRAWVGVPDGRVTQFEAGKPVNVELYVVNSGKTPAIGVHSKHSLNGAVGDNLPEFIFGSTKGPDSLVSIPPQGKITILFHPPDSDALSSPAMDAIKSGANGAYAYGTIWYEDVFGKSHQTDFCMRIVYPGILQACPKHNTMD